LYCCMTTYPDNLFVHSFRGTLHVRKGMSKPTLHEEYLPPYTNSLYNIRKQQKAIIRGAHKNDGVLLLLRELKSCVCR
jgi:hypothetical protein